MAAAALARDIASETRTAPVPVPRFTFHLPNRTITLAAPGGAGGVITTVALRPNALCARGPPRYVTLGAPAEHTVSLETLRSVRAPLAWGPCPAGAPAIPVHLPAWGPSVWGYHRAYCLLVHGLPASLAAHLCALWRAHGLVAGLWAVPALGDVYVAWAVHGALARAVRAMINSGNGGGASRQGAHGRYIYLSVGRAPAGSVVAGTPPLPAAAYATLTV